MHMHEPAHDAFEQHVRKALDQFEVPYNSADWAQMERSLNAGTGGSARSRWSLAALLAGGLLIGGGAFWYFTESTEENKSGIALEGTGATTTPQAATPQAGTDAKQIAAEDEMPVAPKASTGAAEQPSPAESSDIASNPATAAASQTASAEGTAKGASSSTKPVDAGQRRAKAASQPPVTAAPPVTSGEKEQRTFRASVSQACAGTSVDFKVEHMPEDGIYLWNFGDGSFSNKANPEHTFTKPGRYQVMLSMSSAGGGFIQNKPSSDVIVIHEAPKAAFNLVRQEYDGHLPSIHFENRSLGGVKYHWDFGDGQSSDIPHPDHIYKNQGTYQVELTVTNPIGCEDKVMKEVRIAKDYNLDAPFSFSPNGDGKEDTFMPAALQKLGVKFTLSVYDLNGNLMYETKDATLPWAGKPQNRGEYCASGEYVWVVDVRESLHLAETYTGKVKLVR